MSFIKIYKYISFLILANIDVFYGSAGKATSFSPNIEVEVCNCTGKANYYTYGMEKVLTTEEIERQISNPLFDNRQAIHTVRTWYHDLRFRVTFDEEPRSTSWFNSNAEKITRINLPVESNKTSGPYSISFPGFQGSNSQYITLYLTSLRTTKIDEIAQEKDKIFIGTVTFQLEKPVDIRKIYIDFRNLQGQEFNADIKINNVPADIKKKVNTIFRKKEESKQELIYQEAEQGDIDSKIGFQKIEQETLSLSKRRKLI